MDTAFDPAAGRNRAASELTQNLDGLLCSGCRVPVSWVRSHVINGEDEFLRRDVPAFYRLKADGLHAADCPHVPKGQIVQLVGTSRAVEDTPDPFEDRGSDQFVFRINIPRNEISAQKVPGEGKLDGAAFKERAERVWSGTRLTPFCRSAVGLARLWALMDGSHADIQNVVTIQDRGQDISWQDFFFPPIRYASLAHRVEDNKLEHAAAALLVVRGFGQKPWGPFVEGQGMPGRTKEKSIIAPRVFVPERFMSEFEVGGRYIVFGTWKADQNAWTSKDGKSSILFRNLNMTVYQKAQFCRIDLPVEGEDEEV
ncbi:hypothetical protein [Nitrospirillum viridazoti]|nr:hypothetical protein [Nitrospirillum amazonense]